MTNISVYVLHAGNNVDGALGRVTVFDYEEDAREIFDFMVTESLVSINQGLTITQVLGLSPADRTTILSDPDAFVESEFNGFDTSTIARYGSSQDSWSEGIFDEDTQEILDALQENDDLVIHL